MLIHRGVRLSWHKEVPDECSTRSIAIDDLCDLCYGQGLLRCSQNGDTSGMIDSLAMFPHLSSPFLRWPFIQFHSGKNEVMLLHSMRILEYFRQLSDLPDT